MNLRNTKYLVFPYSGRLNADFQAEPFLTVGLLLGDALTVLFQRRHRQAMKLPAHAVDIRKR
jgi:hypothetical protein